MKFKSQRVPRAARIRELATGMPPVMIDWGQPGPVAFDDPEREGLDEIRHCLEQAKRIVEPSNGIRSSNDALELEQELEAIGEKIGALLSALNRTGVFVRAERRYDEWMAEDPDTGALYPMSGHRVYLRVLRLHAVTEVFTAA